MKPFPGWAEAHPRAARLVHLRFFLGQTIAEAAAHLGLDVRTAYRDWAYARAWLRRELDRDGRNDSRIASLQLKSLSGFGNGFRTDSCNGS